jgi:hypothetical protein
VQKLRAGYPGETAQEETLLFRTVPEDLPLQGDGRVLEEAPPEATLSYRAAVKKEVQ